MITEAEAEKYQREAHERFLELPPELQKEKGDEELTALHALLHMGPERDGGHIMPGLAENGCDVHFQYEIFGRYCAALVKLIDAPYDEVPYIHTWITRFNHSIHRSNELDKLTKALFKYRWTFGGPSDSDDKEGRKHL